MLVLVTIDTEVLVVSGDSVVFMVVCSGNLTFSFDSAAFSSTAFAFASAFDWAFSSDFDSTFDSTFAALFGLSFDSSFSSSLTGSFSASFGASRRAPFNSRLLAAASAAAAASSAAPFAILCVSRITVGDIVVGCIVAALAALIVLAGLVISSEANEGLIRDETVVGVNGEMVGIVSVPVADC